MNLRGKGRHLTEVILHFAIFFAPLAFGCVEPWSVGILQVLLSALPVVWLLTQKGKPLTPLTHPLLATMLALTALAAVQATRPMPAWGPIEQLPFTADQASSLRKLLLQMSFIALLLTAPQLSTEFSARIRLAWSVFGVGFLIAMIGICHGDQHFNRRFYGFREVYNGGSLFAPYYNQNHAAGLMEMAFFVGLGLLWVKACQFRSSLNMGRRFDEAISQGLIVFMLGVLAAGIIKSESRGGWTALLAAGSAVCLMTMSALKNSRARWSAVSLVIGILAGLSFGIHGRLEKLRLDKPALARSWAYRLSMHRSASDVLLDFPHFGIGAGAYRAMAPQYQSHPVVGVVEHAHNDWLEIAAEGGLTALIIFCAGLGLLFRRYLYYRHTWPPIERGFAACSMGGFLTLLFHGTVDFNLQIPANAFIFLFIGGALIVPTSQGG